ncbi:hypothetical protein [Steroidobacter cummioxidans]|uniref:hypothetical protein n=1 Tax=Steroidobacter cummioxidans TaxID=1803913 RepID=UPI000E30DD09|nr:hypothetical protein [Steroidobacter cummioxidans]
MTAEHGRLREANERGVPWRKWGPYLRDSGRPRARARSDSEAPPAAPGELRSWAYESSEDGPVGICDEQMRLCFGVAIRAGGDRTLQERLLSMPVTYSRRYTQADNLPTHSYLRAHYRYREPEGSTTHREAACFDVVVEYAKSGPEEILIQIEIKNTSCETATLQVLPQLWFRQDPDALADPRVVIERVAGRADVPCLIARHPELGTYYLHCELAGAFLFTGCAQPVELNRGGTRAAAHHLLILAPRAVQRIRMLLTSTVPALGNPSLEKLFASLKQLRHDANEFFSVITYACDSTAGAFDVRRAFCNMLWNKAVWVSAVTGWLYDRRARSRGGAETHEPASFRLKVAQVVAPPHKRECPHLESPAWLLHTLALACVDADLAAHQLRLLLKGELKNRSSKVSPVHHEWQALKPWAALLMYRLQRPRRPKDARSDLIENFEALSSQVAGGGWAAIRAQSMLEMALELATHDARYEQKAIESYVSFVSAIAALDCEATLLDARAEEADEDPGFRLTISDRMQFQVLSSFGLIALSGAVAFRAGAVVGLPLFCERVRGIHKEHAERICKPDHLRMVLDRVFGAPVNNAWATLPAGMLLIRALSQIEALYGAAIRVRCAAAGGAMMSPGELSQWIVHQHVAARVSAIHRSKLLEFCEYVYMRGAATAGQHTGWAGRVAAMICASWSYSPFEDGVEPPTAIEQARTRESKAQVVSLRTTRR